VYDLSFICVQNESLKGGVGVCTRKLCYSSCYHVVVHLSSIKTGEKTVRQAAVLTKAK